ncbi:MAG: serine hydrolase [Bryobacteraceae bacterium]|nr:serine hydrolase [Bryobacteraceae bacterium]
MWIAVLLTLGLNAEVAWRAGKAEEQGFDRAKLDALTVKLASQNTRAFLVVRRNRLIHEWYAPGVAPSQRQGTASLAKAIAGGTTLMLAMNERRISPDDPASNYIAEWKADPRRARITIRHLATHTSGVEDAEQDDIPHMQLPGWKGAFWKRSPNPFGNAISDAPILFEPGSRFHYSNPGIAALSYAVSAALRGRDVRELLRDRVMTVLGIPESDWAISYNNSVFERDGLRLYATWGGGNFTPRAVARIGQWMMLPAARKMVNYAGMPVDRTADRYQPASGLCWWINHDGVWPGIPRDAFVGAGAGHQMLIVIPSLELVAVRNGAALNDKPFWTAAYEELFRPLLAAIAERESPAPYPPSQLIRGVEFAPVESVVRKAIDSDNWPLTWGGDGDIYTSYGDGRGFEPRAQRKLSLGLAKVRGGPEDFEGINIQSESGERVGDGARGLKSSGMLMVDGVLYMWVRNAGNSQLAWSEDRGRTWTWGFKFEQSFGSPVFLNYGRNYKGARDQYVYVYSQDGPSAYEADDQIVLARVPKDRIREKAAYENLGPVFRFPAHCERVEAIYHEGLKRYLLAVSYNHRGGWGIYEAPHPSGPWRTAFHTNQWDIAGTHGYRFPTKWIEGDTMWLVFSGVTGPGLHYDAFCTRRMRLRR